MSKESRVPEVIRDIAVIAGIVVGVNFGYQQYKDVSQPGTRDHRGEVVRGTEQKLFMTDMGTYEEIPVRSEPMRGEDSILGYVPNKLLFSAQEVYGVPYPSYPETLGTYVYDGKSYGSWYKGSDLPIFEKTRDGNLIPKLDEDGSQVVAENVYIAGNFLRLATEEEISQAQDSK